jgi:hypothetical protein
MSRTIPRSRHHQDKMTKTQRLTNYNVLINSPQSEASGRQRRRNIQEERVAVSRTQSTSKQGTKQPRKSGIFLTPLAREPTNRGRPCGGTLNEVGNHRGAYLGGWRRIRRRRRRSRRAAPAGTCRTSGSAPPVSSPPPPQRPPRPLPFPTGQNRTASPPPNSSLLRPPLPVTGTAALTKNPQQTTRSSGRTCAERQTKKQAPRGKRKEPLPPVIRALRPGQPTEREQPVSWGAEECVGGRRGADRRRKGGRGGWLVEGGKETVLEGGAVVAEIKSTRHEQAIFSLASDSNASAFVCCSAGSAGAPSFALFNAAQRATVAWWWWPWWPSWSCVYSFAREKCQGRSATRYRP